VQRVGDERAEKEYLRRTVGVPVEQSAAIAASMSDDRRKENSSPPAVTADSDSIGD